MVVVVEGRRKTKVEERRMDEASDNSQMDPTVSLTRRQKAELLLLLLSDDYLVPFGGRRHFDIGDGRIEIGRHRQDQKIEL